MREIKFRAWDNRNKRFTKQFYVSADGKPYTYWDDPLPNALDIVLMQYTGLKDKNGKEIYEGDIVRVTDVWSGNTKHQIKYLSDSNYPAFDLVPWLEVETNGLTYCMGSDAEIEIIGNIYENPEMLK